MASVASFAAARTSPARRESLVALVFNHDATKLPKLRLCVCVCVPHKLATAAAAAAAEVATAAVVR